MSEINLERLQAKMREANLSEDDVLMILDNVRLGCVLVPTPLPIIYKKGDAFYIKNGLDPAWRQYVWGIYEHDLCISCLSAKDVLLQENADFSFLHGKDLGIALSRYLGGREVLLLGEQGKKHALHQVSDIDLRIYLQCIDQSFDDMVNALREYGVDCLSWQDARLKPEGGFGLDDDTYHLYFWGCSSYKDTSDRQVCFKAKKAGEEFIVDECSEAESLHPARIAFTAKAFWR